MITNFEKTIYNKFLIASRQNKPFKLRTNFDNLNDDIQNYLKKLAYMFNTYKYIDIDMFFNAPYKLYGDSDYYDLHFYCTTRAIKVYTVYKQQKLLEDVDSCEHLKRIKSTLKFIYTFCKQHNANIMQYLQISSNTLYPTFLLHLKQNEIDPYVLFGYADFFSILNTIPQDVLNVMFNNIQDQLQKAYNVYITSTQCKTLVKSGLSLLSTK